MEQKPSVGTSRSRKRPILLCAPFLGAQGAKKGDLSKFIEEAVADACFSAPSGHQSAQRRCRPGWNSAHRRPKPSGRSAPIAAPNRRPKSLMRLVLDTNIIVSALIAPAGKPAAIIDAWLDGKFTLPDLRGAC